MCIGTLHSMTEASFVRACSMGTTKRFTASCLGIGLDNNAAERGSRIYTDRSYIMYDRQYRSSCILLDEITLAVLRHVAIPSREVRDKMVVSSLKQLTKEDSSEVWLRIEKFQDKAALDSRFTAIECCLKRLAW